LLDSRFEKEVEAYNLATIKLGEIERNVRTNHYELQVARSNLRHAQRSLARRLVEIYQTGTENSTLEVLLGSTSLDDFMNRVDAVNRISDQDSRVLEQVIQFRAMVRKQEGRLKVARALQRQV